MGTEGLLWARCVRVSKRRQEEAGRQGGAQSVEPNSGLFSWAYREKGCQHSRLSVDRVEQTTAILMTIKKVPREWQEIRWQKNQTEFISSGKCFLKKWYLS